MNVQFDIWLKQSSRSLWQDKSFALTVVLTIGIASGGVFMGTDPGLAGPV
ncbi:hypothetical protein [Rheinheimera texasensis]|nr:hypothetical protein [Rheinheimera texasensis]